MTPRPMTRMALVAVAVALLAIGLAGGYWLALRHAAATAMASPSASASQDQRPLYWYDPMRPEQHFDKPGKSPFMDMQLVPKYGDRATAAGVRIAPDVQQNVGIRTALVEAGRLAAEIRVPATLTWDLRLESVVSARADAIVSRLDVKAPYAAVRRGQALATVLAPAWGSALAEAQALGQARSVAARSLQSAAQQRLRMLGLSGSRATGDGRVVLASPTDGVVSEILVREGQSVTAGMPLFRINGTTTVWLEAAIPQAGIAGIGPGTKVDATVSAAPGRTFSGEVEALLPQIDPTSRTQRARIVLRNPDGVLVPGMFAELELRPADGAAVPLVPNEALIATGTDSRVITVDDDGRFQPVRVRTGRSGGGRTEILAGLAGGERVVTSGQFLIDSEASLSGALQRLQAPTMASPRGSAVSSDAAAGSRAAPAHAKAAPARERQVLYWYDPMVPDRHFDTPGTSPFMDMPLLPKYADAADTGTPDSNDTDGMRRDGDREPLPQGDRP